MSYRCNQYKICRILRNSFLLLVFIFAFACSSVKKVPEDKYLLDKYKIQIDEGDVKKEDLKNYVRQKPNKRIFGIKFHLYLYNLSKENKDKGLSGWFKRIGEEPVIFDEFMTHKATEQLQKYLNNKGYFDAKVSDTIIYKKKKASVRYRVTTNEPYIIGKVAYDIADTCIAKIVMKDTRNTVIEPGELFDLGVLDEERERLENLLKNKGFYNFSKEHISFLADSANNTRRIDLTLKVQSYIRQVNNDSIQLLAHPKYKINNLYVFAEYDPKVAIIHRDKYFASVDTVVNEGIHFIHRPENRLKHKIFLQSNFIVPGEEYEQINVDKTHQHLNNMRLFKLVNIEFNEIDSMYSEEENLGYVDAVVQLDRLKKQSYDTELQWTNSSGNMGIGGSISYRNKSLFGGAEILDFRINGSVESIDTTISLSGNTIEFGGEIGLSIPKFLLPVFRTDRFSKKYSPKTRISIGYNYQRRPDYTRTIANGTFGYEWNGKRFTKHIVNPLELNAVKLPFAKQSFLDEIDSTYLEYSYQDHFVSVSSYSYIFNNQNIRKSKDFVYLRINAELSGNIITAVNEIFNSPTVDGSYEIFGIPYSQYAKADIDFRYYRILNPSNSIAYRLFAGVGVPYGNSVALPFEKQYFSGGANSLRAWNVRDVGPGSYNGPSASTFPNQTGDIKLELNAEYRFMLFWHLEGALFLDAGNVWTMIPDRREGAHFRIDEFYNEFAVGTGVGARLKFPFFILRLDMGIKLRDPALAKGERWIIGKRPYGNSDYTFNIAIGYPF